MHPLTFPLALLSAPGATAIPTHAPPLPPVPSAWVSSVTVMSPAQLSALTPYTQFARAAYCSPSIVQGWACGRVFCFYKTYLSHSLPDACQAVPDFEVSLTGGDGNAIQYCNINFSSIPPALPS